MAQIKIDVSTVGHADEFSGRSLDVHAVCDVRGPIVIRLRDEEAARWLHATLGDKISAWDREDEASE